MISGGGWKYARDRRGPEDQRGIPMHLNPARAKVLDTGATVSAVAYPEGRARHSVRADAGNSKGSAQRTDAPYLPEA